jgi:hypothetical protein
MGHVMYQAAPALVFFPETCAANFPGSTIHVTNGSNICSFADFLFILYFCVKLFNISGAKGVVPSSDVSDGWFWFLERSFICHLPVAFSQEQVGGALRTLLVVHCIHVNEGQAKERLRLTTF